MYPRRRPRTKNKRNSSGYCMKSANRRALKVIFTRVPCERGQTEKRNPRKKISWARIGIRNTTPYIRIFDSLDVSSVTNEKAGDAKDIPFMTKNRVMRLCEATRITDAGMPMRKLNRKAPTPGYVPRILRSGSRYQYVKNMTGTRSVRKRREMVMTE